MNQAHPRLALIAVMARGHSRGRAPIALADLNGQPVYRWALQALRALSAEAPLALLAPAPRAVRVARALAADDGLATRVVPVAEDRALAYLDALRAACADLPAAVSVVALHDVTIPVAPAWDWARALAEVGAGDRMAIASQPVHDTIKLARDDGNVYETPPRAELGALQTPLLVPRAALARALARPSVEEGAWAAAPADHWLTALVSRLLAGDGPRLCVIPAGPKSLPIRSNADLSLAARWVGDALSAPG